MNAAQCLIDNYSGYLKFTKRQMSSKEMAEDVLHDIYIDFFTSGKTIENPNYILKVIYFRCKSKLSYENRYTSLPKTDIDDDRYSVLERLIFMKETNNKSQATLTKTNKSGYVGVIHCSEKSYPRLNKRWLARIRIGNKLKNLGYHATAVEAAKAYDAEARKLNRATNFEEGV